MQSTHSTSGGSDAPSDSFLARHEFLIRRLHSLSGLVPVGAYMVVHLLTNATVIDGPGTFQRNVYTIHSLGSLLPLVEWTFIFIPILFHAIFGVVIIRGGLPNTGSYPYRKNYRYTLQRATGMIALAYIFWHVFHMHGWIHTDWWLSAVSSDADFAGAKFRPFNATSTARDALQPIAVAVLYGVGTLSCVYHLANGIWTMGITWGVWITPAAQRRADYVCGAFGVLLSVVALSALFGMRSVNREQAIEIEDRMYKAKVESAEIAADPHKRSSAESHPADRSPSAGETLGKSDK